MSLIFHLPTLATVVLAQRMLWHQRTAASWLSGTVVLGAVGLGSTFLAAGGSLFATLDGFCWLTFAYFPVHAIGGTTLLRGAAPRCARSLGILGASIPLIGLWAFAIEPYWLEVSHHTVPSAKVHRPLRITVLSDLQTDRVGAFERRTLAAVMQSKPDLILLPGDYLQTEHSKHRDDEARKLRAAFADVGFSAPLGVFAVRGDVDGDDWGSIFAGTGIRTVESTTRFQLDEIELTALSPQDARIGVLPRQSEQFHLMFGHAPDFGLAQEELETSTADLLIAGHTHGGQVRLPVIGPLITLSAVPRSWASGRTDFSNGGVLIVSRGIGMERGRAPRLRFLCRPEIVVIDVVPRASEPRIP